MSGTERSRTSQATDFEEDPRYRIAQRESLLCVLYWVVFTVGTIAIAWLTGNQDQSEISFIAGFPDWFFWSAIAFTAFMAIVVPYIMVKFGFTDMDLEPTPEPGTPGAAEVER